MAKSSKDEFSAQCGALDLEASRIHMHQSRIRSIVQEGKSQFFKITDTCRPSNDGLIQSSRLKLIKQAKLNGIISFIPAAGASSRYTQPLASLIAALEENNVTQIATTLEELRTAKIGNMIIPIYLAQVLNRKIAVKDVDLDRLHTELTAPKAFYPCVQEGATFLELKCLEDDALNVFEGTVFVSSTAAQSDFEKILEQRNHIRKTSVIEQGPSQSTIRFDENIEPVRETDGSFSLVPAGHGTLANCLPELKTQFPAAHAVLIRNVDNVIGTSAAVQSEVKTFIGFYNHIWENIVKIRSMLKADRLQDANGIATSLLTSLDLKPSADQEPVWELQQRLFHCTPELLKVLGGAKDKQTLTRLYNRPLNILGQVPNTQKDVGGTPVFVDLEGATFKICLEVPHASPEDKKKFLENPEYATHFNPVFALAEIDFAPTLYEGDTYSSWILAKKTYKGKTVYYHESVLYELLGNNLLANAIFAEIPRLLFNPHKTLDDCKSRTLKDWTGS